MDKQKTKEEVMKEGRAFVRTCELPPWLTQRWRGPTARAAAHTMASPAVYTCCLPRKAVLRFGAEMPSMMTAHVSCGRVSQIFLAILEPGRQKSRPHAPSVPMRSAPAYFLCKWGV